MSLISKAFSPDSIFARDTHEHSKQCQGKKGRGLHERAAGGIVGIQYLSIRVLKSDNSVHEGYAIANILNCLAALDRDRSDYSVFTEDDSEPEDIGRISSLRKAVLKQEAVRGFHIARLSDFPEAVYVSQHFVDIFKENALTGYSFSPVELV